MCPLPMLHKQHDDRGPWPPRLHPLSPLQTRHRLLHQTRGNKSNNQRDGKNKSILILLHMLHRASGFKLLRDSILQARFSLHPYLSPQFFVPIPQLQKIPFGENGPGTLHGPAGDEPMSGIEIVELETIHVEWWEEMAVFFQSFYGLIKPWPVFFSSFLYEQYIFSSKEIILEILFLHWLEKKNVWVNKCNLPFICRNEITFKDGISLFLWRLNAKTGCDWFVFFRRRTDDFLFIFLVIVFLHLIDSI